MSKNKAPVLRNSPRPADLNLNGNIFGGWVLSQMDMAGGIVAAKRARGTVATVAIEGMKFLRPIHIGDLVSCYTTIEKVGKTSITVKIDVTAIRASQVGAEEMREEKVTEGIFIFVALDQDGNPRPVPEI